MFETSGQCIASTSFRLALTASTPAEMNGTELMRQLWAQFSLGMSSRVMESTRGAWTLPSHGMLGVLNLQRGDMWGAVATSPLGTLNRSPSLDTTSREVTSSSRAVA